MPDKAEATWELGLTRNRVESVLRKGAALDSDQVTGADGHRSATGS